MLQYSDINNYKQNINDSGSTSFQVCLLTNKVIKLTEHLKIHKKDYRQCSKYGRLEISTQ